MGAAEPRGADRRVLWLGRSDPRGPPQYAAAGVTQIFLQPNFQPGDAELARVVAQMEALAPVAD